MFSSHGTSNPDMQGDWLLSYFPPTNIRIVNRQAPPDIEFVGKNIADEALRYRRVDSIQLLAEIELHPRFHVLEVGAKCCHSDLSRVERNVGTTRVSA